MRIEQLFRNGAETHKDPVKCKVFVLFSYSGNHFIKLLVEKLKEEFEMS